MIIVDKFSYPVDFSEYKVKRRWWTVALFIFLNGFGVLSLRKTVYILIAILIIDIILILPDALHMRYIINDKFIIVKRFIYPDIEIPLGAITQIDVYYLLMMPGFGVKIIENTDGGYRIIYSISRSRRKVVIVSPKEPKKFIGELSLHLIDKSVITINSDESAFKRKKDKI